MSEKKVKSRARKSRRTSSSGVAERQQRIEQSFERAYQQAILEGEVAAATGEIHRLSGRRRRTASRRRTTQR